MRGVVQIWCRSRKTFAPLRSSVEIAAVSTAASESESCVSALGWHGSWPEEGRGKGKAEREATEKEKVRARKVRRRQESQREKKRWMVDRTVPWFSMFNLILVPSWKAHKQLIDFFYLTNLPLPSTIYHLPSTIYHLPSTIYITKPTNF